MASKVTSDQVVGAAQDLAQPEFTRADLAEKLGVKTTDLKQGVKDARESGKVEKVRDDDEGTGHFRLAETQ
jgi:DNA-binding transcriptional regulator LsrR (DeoR family)